MRLRRRSIALGAVVTAAASLPLVVTMTADAGTDRLLSKGRPVTASSVQSTRYAAAKAVDGSGSTRWASAPGAGSQWLRVDLGALQRVDRVRLVWESAYAKAYQVQTSVDGATWGNLYSTRSGDGGTDDLTRLVGTGRYLRVLATQRGTTYGYSLWEVQVYGSGTAVTPKPAAPTAVPPAAPGTGLDDPVKKDIAMQLVTSAENSTLNWRGQYRYIEDLGDGRGYTAGIIGFCSGTSDMLAVVSEYTRRDPANGLARYLPALRAVNGSDSHDGLDPDFPAAWRAAADDPLFQQVQQDERDRIYFDPSVKLAKADGLRALGQFAYYDAAVMHGVYGMGAIRAAALRAAASPTLGGDEVAYLGAFLDAREATMRTEAAHADTARVQYAQRVFLTASNLDLNTPLSWTVYGDRYQLPTR
jgi:chitosanase